MLDNLDPRERQTDAPAPSARETSGARPLADREVPLGGQAMSATIDAWLDGEVPESAVRHGVMARDVEFWKRIEREVEVRREMKTPVHVYQQIMESLPESAPQALPWWKRQMTVSPLMALAAAAGAIAVGAALAAMLLHAAR